MAVINKLVKISKYQIFYFCVYISEVWENKNVLFFSTITSPMEEGTPTAPLNLSNSTSNNILGKYIS